MKQVAVCPECNELALWTSFFSNGNLLYRCGNCWHHVNQFSLDRLPQNTLPDEAEAMEFIRFLFLELCEQAEDTRIDASFEPDHEKK